MVVAALCPRQALDPDLDVGDSETQVAVGGEHDAAAGGVDALGDPGSDATQTTTNETLHFIIMPTAVVVTRNPRSPETTLKKIIQNNITRS